ncbi:MAG: glycosyltransferase family protein [Magnetococcales bacterium]|nr:glycosyltransferase family protein [Magnetococcales bacterium]
MPSSAADRLQEQLKEVIDLQKTGHDKQAVAQLQAMIKQFSGTQFSGHSRLNFLLGLSLYNLENYNNAADHISRAITIEPTKAEYHTFLGVILNQLGKNTLAAIRWKEAIRLNPSDPEPYFHLGDQLIDEGRPQEAIEWLTKAAQQEPDFLEAWNNLGLCHKALKQLEPARECFQKAIQLDPDHTDPHINLSMTLLIMGDYFHGWQEYDWRFKRPDSPLYRPPPPGVPLWQGEPLKGKRLLILSEQGFGDTVQFIRYLSVLKKQGAILSLLTPRPLAPLLQEMDALDQVDTQSRPEEAYDYYCPLLTLPKLLKTTLPSIPQTVPYLQAEASRIQQWQKRLPPAALRVGLIWEGKPLFKNDPLRRRSTTLKALAPLAQSRTDTLFVSLQKGDPAGQADDPPQGMRVLNPDSEINDFADTAAIMANLDLIISIDTATAHLAGALGCHTWVLLPFSPDWRWGLDQDNTPWYPQARLFRQSQPNQWKEPIAQMAEQLRKWPVK